MPEILIEHCQDWLSEYDYVEIDGEKYKILTCNNHGDLQVGTKDDFFEVNISSDYVTVL